MGISGESNNAHLEDKGQSDADMSESLGGPLPDMASLSSAYRENTNVLHQSLSYRGTGPQPQLIVNECDEVLYCDRDTSDLLANNNNVAGGSSPGGSEGEEQGTSALAGSMMIVNACLGAGLLNFPSAFHEAGGVMAGNMVQIAMLLFIYPALVTLAFCSDWNKSKTLQEVLSNLGGRRFEQISAVCVALYSFGTCTTFLIIAGDQFDRIFASLVGPYFCHTWYMNRTFTTTAAAFCFVLPFCYPKKIDFLKHICSVGVVAVLYIALLSIIQYYRGIYTPGEIRTEPENWTDLFLVVPPLCFAYQCHVSTIPIYSCFKKRNMKNFVGASSLAFVICIFVYTSAATFGYLTFGSRIASDILSSYDANDPLVIIGIVMISVKTYTTYPILCFCGNAAVCDLWVDARAAQGVLEVDPRIKERFRLISVTIWFILTLCVAIFMPNIGSVIKFLGSFAAIFIFIFPGICFLRMAETSNGVSNYPKPRTTFQVLAAIFICVGGFLFGVVTTNAIIFDFIKVQVDPEPLCLLLPLNSTVGN